MDKLNQILPFLIEHGIQLGIVIIKAVVIFIVGRYIIKLLKKLIHRVLVGKNIAPAVRSFSMSLVNILLNLLLAITVISVLGIQTTSFAALLASAGVAVGMALSGNLSNFAGGVIILIFKPFKIGDYIVTSTCEGTVQEIQIFHTIIRTPQGIMVYIPNGTLSSNYINNYNIETRRVEWIVGVDYGEDYDKVRQVIVDILATNQSILNTPVPLIELKELAGSSVNIIIRAWTNASDYWAVYYDINQKIYKTFNEKGIDFPFPQLTVHQANN